MLGLPQSGSSYWLRGTSISGMCRHRRRSWTSALGTIALYSVYLYDGVKLGLKNIRILKALGEDIQRRKCPSIVGGGFNVNPALLSEHVQLHDLDLVIRAPEAHAYRSKDTRTKIDFFLVSALLDRVAPTISVDLN
eukprot:3321171-Pyramimonas_sp.AAC.1